MTRGRTNESWQPGKLRRLDELDANFLSKWGKEHSQALGLAGVATPNPRNFGRAVATELDRMGGELTIMQKQQLLSLVEMLIDVVAANDQSTYRRVMSRILNDLNSMGLVPPSQPAVGEALVRMPSGTLMPESYYRGVIRRTILLEQESTAAKVGQAVGKGVGKVAKALGQGIAGAAKGIAGEVAPGAGKKAASMGKMVASGLKQMFGGEMPGDITPQEQAKTNAIAKRMGAEFTKMGIAPQGSEKVVEMIMQNVSVALAMIEDPKAARLFAMQLAQAIPKIPAFKQAVQAQQKQAAAAEKTAGAPAAAGADKTAAPAAGGEKAAAEAPAQGGAATPAAGGEKAAAEAPAQGAAPAAATEEERKKKAAEPAAAAGAQTTGESRRRVIDRVLAERWRTRS